MLASTSTREVASVFRPVPAVAKTGRPRPPIPIDLLLAAMRIGDALAVFSGGLAAGLLIHSLSVHAQYQPQILVSLAVTTVTTFFFGRLNAYDRSAVRNVRRGLLTRLIGLLPGVPMAIGCIALLPSERVLLPIWPVAWLAASLLFLAAGHMLAGTFIRRWADEGGLSRRVAVVGVNQFSESFLERVASRPSDGVEIVGVYRDYDDEHGDFHGGHPVIGRIGDVVAHSRRERIDAVVLAIPLTQPERIAHAKRALACIVSDVYLTTGLTGLQFKSTEVQDFASTPMVRVTRRPLDTWQMMEKTTLDRFVAILLLCALSLPLLLIAILIKIDSPGPVLFRQPRLGFNNLMFTVYKFRTMKHGSADLLAERQTRRGDDRITRVGRLLRRFSLDELPQLLNVLGGSMSLVGPRPHAPNTKAGDVLFHDAVAEYALRHRVKPGITGWAQVNGWRGETKTLQQIEQRVAHDLWYIDNWSLKLDFRILLLTVTREINSKTAF